MKGGKRSDMPYINFYLDYFAQGKPAFVPIQYMSFRHAVEMIKDNGGIPIVAHPGLNLKEGSRLLRSYWTMGLKVWKYLIITTNRIKSATSHL